MSTNTYAQIVNGAVINPCFGDTLSGALAATFAAAYVQEEVSAGRPWVQVPNGTLPGSTSDGQGGYVPPAAPVVVPQPIEMSGKQFTNYCAAVLAQVNSVSPAAGLVRFGQIIASMKASADPLTTVAFVSFQAALTVGGKFTLADATTLFSAIVANGAQNTMTVAEEAALITNWTKQ